LFIVQADLPERCSIGVPAVINNILPERRSGSKIFARRNGVQPRSGTTTPVLQEFR